LGSGIINSALGTVIITGDNGIVIGAKSIILNLQNIFGATNQKMAGFKQKMLFQTLCHQ
jgi:hypothetical protein